MFAQILSFNFVVDFAKKQVKLLDKKWTEVGMKDKIWVYWGQILVWRIKTSQREDQDKIWSYIWHLLVIYETWAFSGQRLGDPHCQPAPNFHWRIATSLFEHLVHKYLTQKSDVLSAKYQKIGRICPLLNKLVGVFVFLLVSWLRYLKRTKPDLTPGFKICFACVGRVHPQGRLRLGTFFPSCSVSIPWEGSERAQHLMTRI